MIDMTAIILTKNEEKNIGFCINSIKNLCKRIIVVDSFSDDNTCEIAKELGAEVYYNKFINYSKQFKYGLFQTGIDTKWVLRLDADERITPGAAEEIEKLCTENENTDVNGLVLRFTVTFLGKELYHGGIYPFRKLLVFKREFGDIEDRNMDEHIVLSKGTTLEVKTDCEHHDFKDITTWINKHNWYSSREIRDYYELNEEQNKINSKHDKIKSFVKFKIYYKLPIGMRAHMYYWYRYYIKLGFLDGKEGKMYAFLQAYWYRYLVDVKIYEHEKMKTDFGELGDLKK